MSEEPTIGARIARRLGFQHIEMSSYANSAFLQAVENREFEGTLQDYMVRVFWADGEDDRVASELLRSNPDLDGLVITGPRKPAEVETLQDAGYATELIYVYADSRTRHSRYVMNAAQYGGTEQLLSLTGFVHRDLLENSWGLPKIGLMENCRIVENQDLEAAVGKVERRMHQRRWGDLANPELSRQASRRS